MSDRCCFSMPVCVGSFFSFLIVEQDTLELTVAQAQLLLGQTEGSIDAFTSGPCVAFLLKRVDAYTTFNSLRLELDYTYGSQSGWLALRDRATFFPKDQVLERLFVLIKPSSNGEAGGETYAEVMSLVEKHDFVVLGKEMKVLGSEAAAVVAVGGADQSEEIEYLTSDVSILLCLEKVGAIQEFLLLVGPNSVVEARRDAPHTLRARLGALDAPSSHNLLYVSDSSHQSSKDLSIFFPKPFLLERTVLILKPDVFQHHGPQRVLDLLVTQGFTITSKQELYISKLRAETYLSHMKGEPSNYEVATKYLSSGPSLVLLLTKSGAISHLNKLLGPSDPVTARSTKPNSLRAQLGTDSIRNGLHSSETFEESEKDMREFFTNMSLEKIPDLQQLHQLLSQRPSEPQRANSQTGQRSVYEVLIDGLTQLCRVKPTGDDAVIYLANWLLQHNPYKPEVVPPEEVKPQVTLAEELDTTSSPSSANASSSASSAAAASVASGPLQVTWIVGSPGSRKSELVSRVTKDLLSSGISIEHIDVHRLLLQSTKTSSEFGNVLVEYLESERVVPAKMLNELLIQAIAKASSRNVVLTAFPYSFDQSFEFERTIGEASKSLKQLIYLEIHPSEQAKLLARLRSSSNGGNDDAIETYEKKLKTFIEDVVPVIEQYELFNKVRKIDVGVEEEDEVCKQLKKLLTPKK